MEIINDDATDTPAAEQQQTCYDHGLGLPRTIFFSYLIYLPFT